MNLKTEVQIGIRRQLDKMLNMVLSENKIAGMSVAVTDKDRVIYSKGFGVLSTERPDISTPDDALYRVASVTKMVTGLCIMRLCDDGVLSLDTPIAPYLPWLSLGGEENKITLKHLLSHTSGLPAEYTPDGPREEAELLPALKKELADAKLRWSPDEGRFLYSNLGIRLASYIATLKTGKPFSALADELVLKPLGMDKSTFDLRVAATYSLSLPHDETEGQLIPGHYIKENAVRLAAGGLYSNVSDLSKLLRCIINGGKSFDGCRVVSPEAMKKMLTPLVLTPDILTDAYGITMARKIYDGGTFWGHLGNASPYGASALADLERGIGIVVLMNTFRSRLRCEIPCMIMDIIK